MNRRIVNPECRDGKHSNCDGHGWDIDADTAVRCPCACHHEMSCGDCGKEWAYCKGHGK